MPKRRLPKEIESTLRKWIGIYRRWWVFHYILGISALACSITVASRPQLQGIISANSPFFGLLAWLAALTVGLITFLMPSKKARSYVAAARLPSDARNRYENDSDYPAEKLFDAVKLGEQWISQSEPI